MNRSMIIFCMVCGLLVAAAQPSMAPTGLIWDETYSFDKCNVFVMEFYAKNHELMKTRHIKTFYQTNGENFLVQNLSEIKGNGTETLIDKKNEIAIQMFGTGGGATPMYNAGAFKYPAAEELKQLPLLATDETKQIVNLKCRKYTYTYKKIFGEVWITDEVNLPNDIGVFRACKMAALHNTLSVPGFVMEMTTEDDRGGKTLMKSVSLQKEEKYNLDLKGVEISKAINKVNYYTF